MNKFNSNMDNMERQKLASLCNLAAEGKLTLDDLDSEWAPNLQSAFAKQVLDDIEDAIEHFPAKLFSKTPDWEMWEKSKLHISLIIDSELLKSELTEDALLSVKIQLSNVKIRSIGEARDETRKVMAKIQEKGVES